MDTETGGDSAPREASPAPRPEQNRDHVSAGRREPEEQTRSFRQGDLLRDESPNRNRDREAAPESPAPEPAFDREPQIDRHSESSRSEQRDENNEPTEGSAHEPPSSNPAVTGQTPGGGQGQRRDQGRPRFPRRDRGRGRRGPAQRLPERPGGGERPPDRRGPDPQREPRREREREFDQAPVPTRHRSGSPLAEAVFEVDRIRQVLEGVLQDIEHVLGQLEQAEADQTASEQEIESLRRSLESLHRSTHLPRG